MTTESQAPTKTSDIDYNAIIHPLSFFLLTLFSSIFVARGIADASIGIANAADIRMDTTMVVIPMGFETASLIYTLIMFVMAPFAPPTKIHDTIFVMAGALVTSVGSACGAYSVGKVTKNAIVARAQNKQFSTYFLIMLMFSEIVAVFSLLMGILLVLQQGKH